MRPWVTGGSPTGDFGPINVSQVLWRYDTLDQRFFMVHIAGTYKWRFISVNCINNAAELTTMNPYTPYWF